ncbi:hypothetical protein ATY30_02370 [Sinorhizobium americanum]|nr:hypothetical protein ATY30_02370 [Sinorhizobium americanum]
MVHARFFCVSTKLNRFMDRTGRDDCRYAQPTLAFLNEDFHHSFSFGDGHGPDLTNQTIAKDAAQSQPNIMTGVVTQARLVDFERR